MSSSSTSLIPRSTPETQGVSSAGILSFLDAVLASGQEMHSFMLLRHGHVLAEAWWEPYRPEMTHVLYSLSKSFASTAAGLATAEGKLSLDDEVLSFFPEDAPAEISANLQAMRVRHLLSMSTGNAADTTRSLSTIGGDNWVKGFLACPVEHVPGTQFVYNSGATYMVSAILQKVTGERLLDYLTPRLLQPLGIVGATWETCPRGIDIGGWGLSIKTEDIARFGRLYLQRGLWNGVQLVPEAWIAEATSKHVSNGDNPESDWNQGYGFQFWRCRHGAYRGDGAFGQYCVVMPEQDAVVAITSGLKNMQLVLNLVWEHLLPAFHTDALPEDPFSLDALNERIKALKVRTPEGSSSSDTGAAVSGRTYRFEANDLGYDALGFDFEPDPPQIAIHNSRGEHRFPCGVNGEWMRSTSALFQAAPQPIAAAGAWTDAQTFEFRICAVETPWHPTLTCTFDGGEVRLNYVANCGFRSEPYPQMVGQAES